MNNIDREAWLTEAATMIIDEHLMPIVGQLGLSPSEAPWRVSVGFPPRTRGTRVLAVCTASKASSSGHNEIFVTPSLDDSLEILSALTHELIHQLDDCQSGHRGFFAAVARAAGLEGKLTSTYAGEDLEAYLNTLIDVLGPIPHSSLNLDQAKKKQPTRMLKVTCGSCGFHFRTSERQLAKLDMDHAPCPACTALNLETTK